MYERLSIMVGGMVIWFKRIDDRVKEFIKMFVRDYL